MGIIALLMILVAPIIQIIWSNRRVRKETQMPIGGIAIIMAALGMGLSLIAFYLLCSQLPPSNDHGVCMMPEASFIITGGLISVVLMPSVGLIYLIVYYIRNSSTSGEEEAIAKVNEVLKKHYR